MGQGKTERKGKKTLLLRKAYVITRSDRSKLRTMAESLWQKFEPRNPYEEFILEKLIVDLGRLAKLYEYEKKQFDASELESDLANGYTTPFIRYKNSIEKDIYSGYARLEAIKRARF